MKLVALFLLAPFSASAADLPEWVVSPNFYGGIAAAECVVFSGSLSIDRQQAVAEARVALAQEIEIRVKSVDKLFTERTTNGKNVQTKTVFQRASEQLTDRVLNNSRTIKTEIIKNVSGTDKLCAMVALPAETTKEYFREMVVKVKTDNPDVSSKLATTKVANVDVPSKLEDDLFAAFAAKPGVSGHSN